MIRTVIFDLSEVLIAGLVGIEKPLGQRFNMPAKEVLEAFGGDHLLELLHGRSSEEVYLNTVRDQQGWDITVEEIKAVIRQNFHQQVPGMDDILARLAQSHELVLLSDHGLEWVAYIQQVHPFLAHFSRQFYSCELGSTKHSPATFETVLKALGRKPSECLFIDDNAQNVRVARSVGLYATVFRDAVTLRSDLRTWGLGQMETA